MSGCRITWRSAIPHELSGGQRQRIGIARALAHQAADSSFATSRSRPSTYRSRGRSSSCSSGCSDEHGLTYLFIAHDLARRPPHREPCRGDVSRPDRRASVLRRAVHGAAAPLHAGADRAVPVPEPAIERFATRRAIVAARFPRRAPPSGCVFHTRCPLATAECRQEVPALREIRSGHFAACIKV